MSSENNLPVEIRARTVTRVKLTVDNGAITNTEVVFTPVGPPAPPPTTEDQNQTGPAGESGTGSETSGSGDTLGQPSQVDILLFVVDESWHPMVKRKVELISLDHPDQKILATTDEFSVVNFNSVPVPGSAGYKMSLVPEPSA